MKKVRFTESQIISILSQQEKGVSVKDICRENRISNATFFNWKAKYGGMAPNQLKRLKEYMKDGKYYAAVSASAFTPAGNIGDVTYSGTVDVMDSNKVVDTYSLTPYSGPSISQSGWTNVGQNVFALPGYSTGDVYLRFNVGYSYTEGAGHISPFPAQGHYRMRIGFTIDAWSY